MLISFQNRLLKDNTDHSYSFQPIDNKTAWLYSAFFDHVAAENGTPLVRIFAVVRREFLKSVYCHFSLDSKRQTTTGLITPMPDGHDKE